MNFQRTPISKELQMLGNQTDKINANGKAMQVRSYFDLDTK